ncbi:MAG: condensation domain-containing protein, partial [Bacteroidota bacterium]
MATSTQNKKIEAIYPLTPIQQGFLFHHLTSSEDQGFLNVQCALQGPLHIMDFKKSWGSAVKRHAVLRTSIHWKKIKHPVLVVSPDKEVDWNYLDWSEFSKDQYGESLTALKKNHKETGVNFEKAPLAHIVLIKKGEDSYVLLWSCHHLLIDGWSTSIILQDVFEFYHALRTNTTPNLGTIPTYDTYLNWLKKNKEPQAPDFWKKMFYGFKPKLFFKEPKTSTSGAYTSNVIAISENTSEDLKLLAKQSHLTMNSLLQGIWSVLLAKHSGVYDVCFGTTVSGRSALFPKIESITGMFVNVLPVRANFTKSTTFIGFLQQLQLEQQESRNYEHSTLEEIISWTALPATVKMFDNLFVFENFPWEDIDKGGVLVKDFQSGISTTYPATLVVKGGKFFKINLLVNSQVIPQQVSEWFLKNFQKASYLLTQETSLSVQDILEHLDAPHFNDNALLEPTEQNTSSTGHSKSLPRDEQELELKAIWETVFEDGPIGIHDNFFELGGKSMLAIKLFSRIENNMGIKLPPTTLIEHPTIASLASSLDVREEKKPWQNLVPIKPKGNKAPLFCVHAAGSHFFYYNHLRNYVNA